MRTTNSLSAEGIFTVEVTQAGVEGSRPRERALRALFRFLGRIITGFNKYAASLAAIAVFASIIVTYYRTASLGTDIYRAKAETRVVGYTIFGLIAALHSDNADKVREAEDEYNQMLIHISLIGALSPPAQEKEIFIARSKVDPNKWAFRLPSKPKGTSRPVYAIHKCRVNDGGIGKDERGLIALQTSDENGYSIEYDHLTRLGPGVVQGKKLEQEQLLGFIEAASEPCLRIGIKTPQGRYIDPRALFSPPIPTWPH